MSKVPVAVKSSVPRVAEATDPWKSFRSELDRLFDRFAFAPLRGWWDATPAPRAHAAFEMASPAIDIVEEDAGYKLTAELPGLSEKDIELVVSGDKVTLKGEKKQETERKEKNHTLSERSYGSFERTFWLPDDVDRDNIAAEFRKGVLTVTLPKTPGAVAEPRKIDVKAAA